MTFTEQELLDTTRAYVAKWQPRLHLQDWQVTVAVVDFPDEDHAGCTMRINCNDSRRMARIEVAKAWNERAQCAYRPPGEEQRSLEEDALHELLHLLERPYATVMANNVDWVVGPRGLVGEDVRTQWEAYRHWWMDALVRVLLEADRSGGWIQVRQETNDDGSANGEGHPATGPTVARPTTPHGAAHRSAGTS